MALPFDKAFDEYNAERLRSADTLLEGRVTFEQALSYWPSVQQRDDAPPVEHEISQLLAALDKIVVSDSLRADQTTPWTNTRIVKRADARRQVAEAKRQPGRDIIVFGSHTLWNDLILAGLVDELHIMIGPALLGAGTPVFEGESPVALRLMSSRTLSGSELVLARYSVSSQSH